MKASELIRRLKNHIEDLGDCPVYLSTDGDRFYLLKWVEQLEGKSDFFGLSSEDGMSSEDTAEAEKE